MRPYLRKDFQSFPFLVPLVFTITCGMASPCSVLLVGDVFKPVHGLAIELLLHRDVRHRRGGRGTVPVFFAGCEPHDVTWANLFDGSAPALDPARPGGHDQRLAERMGVPGGARAGLECHGRTRSSGGSGGLKQRIDTDGGGKPVTGSFRGRLRTCSSDLHRKVPFNVLSTPQNLAESPEKNVSASARDRRISLRYSALGGPSCSEIRSTSPRSWEPSTVTASWRSRARSVSASSMSCAKTSKRCSRTRASVRGAPSAVGRSATTSKFTPRRCAGSLNSPRIRG